VIEAELGNKSRALDLLEEAWQSRVVHFMWAGADNVLRFFEESRDFKRYKRDRPGEVEIYETLPRMRTRV
jgi:hypothetical protein